MILGWDVLISPLREDFRFETGIRNPWLRELGFPSQL